MKRSVSFLILFALAVFMLSSCMKKGNAHNISDSEYTKLIPDEGESFAYASAANQVSYTVPLAEASKHFTSHVGTGVIVTVVINTQTRTIVSVDSPLASTTAAGGYNPAGRHGRFDATWANRYNQLLPSILAAYKNKPVDPIINVDFGAGGYFSNATKLRLSAAGIPLYNASTGMPREIPEIITTGATTGSNLGISFGNLAHSVQYALKQMVLLAQITPSHV